MLDEHFVYLGVLVSLAFGSRYIWSTARGSTSPNRVTWFMWAVIPVPALLVELRSGVGVRSLITFVACIYPLMVFAVSFVNTQAVWRIGKADWTCGALAAIGTTVWATTNVNAIGLAAALSADVVAGVPTFVKSWRRPESESISAYIGSASGSLLTLLTVHQFTAAQVAFPLLLFSVGALEVLLVGGRIGPRIDRLRAARGRSSTMLNTQRRD